MIWQAPTSGNLYFRSNTELLDGESFTHEGRNYVVTGYSARDERGERNHYWYYVEEVA